MYEFDKVLIKCPKCEDSLKLFEIFRDFGIGWKYAPIRKDDWLNTWNYHRDDTVFCIEKNILTVHCFDYFYDIHEAEFLQYQTYTAAMFIKRIGLIEKTSVLIPVVVSNSESDNLHWWNFAYYNKEEKTLNLGGADKSNVNFKYAIPTDKFNFNHPTKSLEYNLFAPKKESLISVLKETEENILGSIQSNETKEELEATKRGINLAFDEAIKIVKRFM